MCVIHISLDLFPFTLILCDLELRQHHMEEEGLGAACVVTCDEWLERLYQQLTN